MFFNIILILILIFLFILILGKKRKDLELTDEFKTILELLEESHDGLFITGNAGTGKSTLIKLFVRNTKKKVVLLAPTGIAALNIGGQTIHSFFKYKKLIKIKEIQPDYERNLLFKNLDTIIIDEVSMLRADLVDYIDKSLRLNRNIHNIPFGGVQLVFVGDLFQLPPVVDNNSCQYIKQHYDSEYFFAAKVFQEYFYKMVELTKVFRQKDKSFINILNRIRINNQSFNDMVQINQRTLNNVTKPNEEIITLTTTNRIANQTNLQCLAKLPTPEKIYFAKISGTFEKTIKNKSVIEKEYRFPADYKMVLKVGSQIMMIKNDRNKRWVNGSLGTIKKLENDCVWVQIDGHEYRVDRETWTDIKYEYDRSENNIIPKKIGTYEQFPIKLAWAITIHKSQGKSFQRALIDFGGGTFAHGQAYVALSRIQTFHGLYLKREFRDREIIVDPMIINFYQKKYYD